MTIPEIPMTEEMNTVFNEAKAERLSQNERARMRNFVSLFVKEHPARAPLSLRIADALENTFARIEASPFVHASRVVPSAFALVLILGLGTSYAAENSLPGDALYPVKILLNEPVQGLFASSDAAQAQWNTELVTRRLVEAEQLASEGRLTPVARASLQSSIAISTADFNVHVAKLAEADNSTEVAQAQSTLEASLAGHEQVLSALASSENTTAIAPLLATVSVHKEAAASARFNAEEQAAKKGGAPIKAAAISTRKEAHDAIKQVNAAITTAQHDGATTTIEAHASALSAQDEATEGEMKLESGDFGKAFSAFQAAVRTAQSTQVHVDAQVRLKSDLSVDGAAMDASTSTSASATTSAQ